MAPISEARKRANKKWNDAHMKERYEMVQLVLPKGRKEALQTIAERHEQSVTAFMMSLLDAALACEASHTILIMVPIPQNIPILNLM